MRRTAVQCARLCAVLALVASCTSHSDYFSTDGGNSPSGPTGSSTTGTIIGTITSSLGGALSGVQVAVTPAGGTALAAVTTSGSGAFAAPGVPTSKSGGSVTVSALPTNCQGPASSTYTGLTAGDTVTVNITVVCSGSVGVIRGTVTSSLGGGLGGVAVVVTPHNGTAMPAVATNPSGVFVVSNVPADTTGTVTLTTVPSNCTAPANATSYSGLALGDTVSVAITVTCTSVSTSGTGTVTGTVTSSLGGALSGVQVTVTPTGGSAFAAVPTTSGGGYTVSHVPVGGGAVTLTGGLPAQCSAPSAVAYSGLTSNGTATANVVATCQALGSLTVTLSPSPTQGAVTVTGPNNYTQTLTQTTTLSSLVPGSYTVTAPPYEVPQAWVGVVYNATVAGSPANVTGGATSNVTVTYGVRGGSGALWAISGSAGVAYELTNAQLSASGSVTTGNSTPSGSAISGAAVDLNGTMWLVGYTGGGFGSSGGSGVLYGLTPSNLASGNLSSPAISGTPSLLYPAGAAFDASGNFWVVAGGTASFFGNPITLYTIDGYTPAQLAAGGSSGDTWSAWTPAWQGTTSSAEQPVQLAFGPHGNLWVAVSNTSGSGGSLEEFTPAGLMSGANPQGPIVTITLGDVVSGMAFDQNQNLWVTLYNTGKIAMFTQSQLFSGGSPTPTVTLSGVSAPTGIAFDDSGDLWVLSQTTQRLYAFSPFQVLQSGTPTPQVSISFPASNYPNMLVFDPHASTLPLNGSRVVARPAAVKMRGRK